MNTPDGFDVIEVHGRPIEVVGTLDFRSGMEPRPWRLREALVVMRFYGCPWYRRWWFALRWVVKRGRNVRV